MNTKKGLRYYAFIFILSVIALAVYFIYLYIKNGEFDSELALSLFSVPFMFTVFLFLFDKVLEFIIPNKARNKESMYTIYLDKISKAIQAECSFTIEEYSRLRKNQKFQKLLQQAYRIFEKGETETINFQFLERKFQKNTNEYTASLIVIREVKQMMGNS